MRLAIVLLFFVLSLHVAYGGDCKACHVILDIDYDVEHKVLVTCKMHHTSDQLINSNMGMEACGVDCFLYHDTQIDQANRH